MCGSSTANSSPPSRASRSVSRSRRLSARATACSASSPACSPWLSLTRLKRVEVDHHQPGDLAVALRARDLQLEVVLEQPAVAQAGQRIVVGQVAQVLLQALALGDVLQLGDVVQRRRRRWSRTSDIERIAETRLAGGVEVALLDLVARGSRRPSRRRRCSRRCRRRPGARSRRSACRSAPRRCSR